VRNKKVVSFFQPSRAKTKCRKAPLSLVLSRLLVLPFWLEGNSIIIIITKLYHPSSNSIFIVLLLLKKRVFPTSSSTTTTTTIANLQLLNYWPLLHISNIPFSSTNTSSREQYFEEKRTKKSFFVLSFNLIFFIFVETIV
jgi:hypothetical protein